MKKKQIQQPEKVLKRERVWYITLGFKDNTTKQYLYQTQDDRDKDLEQIKQANWQTDKFISAHTIVLLSEIREVNFGDYLNIKWEYKENNNGTK